MPTASLTDLPKNSEHTNDSLNLFGMYALFDALLTKRLIINLFFTKRTTHNTAILVIQSKTSRKKTTRIKRAVV
jgi:hypothetical protein